MKPNQYPFRRKLAAIGALAGLVATGAACTTDASPARTKTVTIVETTTAPAPKPTEAKPIEPSEQLLQAEARLRQSALKAAEQIAEDTTNPNSRSEAYAQTNIGNKRLELADGLEKQAGFPEMLLTYDTKSRSIFAESITSPNPNARLKNERFNGITLNFSYTGNGLNILDKQLAAGKQLVSQDYIKIFSEGTDLHIDDVQTTHGDAVDTTILTSKSGELEYSKGDAPSATPITDANRELLDAMSRDIEATSISLHSGI